MSIVRSRGASLLALLVLGAIVGYCHSKQAESAPIDHPKRDVPYLDGNGIRYSADYARRSRIEFSRVGRRDLAPVVNVTGTVTFDPALVVAIGARVAGQVKRIHKLEGDAVSAGDIVAEIESVELGKAQAAVSSARAQATAATANERREVELAEAHVSSRRTAELAIAGAAAARAALMAAEQRVRAMCVDTCGADGILKLISPIGGRVIERSVMRGQSVEPTQTTFRIADLSRLWVQLAVFERHITAIHVGDPVDLFPQCDPRRQVTGRVAYVGDVIDLETRTAPVRVVLDHPEVRLWPGESALAKVHTSAGNSAVLAVPRAAVTTVDGRPTVFVARDALSVEPRNVGLGGQDGDLVEIVAGLRDGDSVATSGVFALKSEIFR